MLRKVLKKDKKITTRLLRLRMLRAVLLAGFLYHLLIAVGAGRDRSQSVSAESYVQIIRIAAGILSVVYLGLILFIRWFWGCIKDYRFLGPYDFYTATGHELYVQKSAIDGGDAEYTAPVCKVKNIKEVNRRGKHYLSVDCFLGETYLETSYPHYIHFRNIYTVESYNQLMELLRNYE